jgi:hypothetical protein
MKLPFASEAEVPKAKIVLYLLNLNHSRGKGKARFFLAHGFNSEKWETFVTALRRHAVENDIARQINSRLGLTFVIEGPMITPNEKVALVRSVWFIETGEKIPRFVTAYPLRQRKQI